MNQDSDKNDIFKNVDDIFVDRFDHVTKMISVNSWNVKINDSRAHNDHVTNSKSYKFMQQKAAIDATLKI